MNRRVIPARVGLTIVAGMLSGAALFALVNRHAIPSESAAEMDAEGDQLQARSATEPAHCGVLYRLADGGANAILTSYRHGGFAADTSATLPLQQTLLGHSSRGTSVQVVIDSLDTSYESYASQYHASVRSQRPIDPTEVVLFCDTGLSFNIQPSRPGILDSTAATAIRNRIGALHDKALRYDPEVMLHDSLDFQAPTIVEPATAPGMLVVTYPITLRLKKAPSAPGDDRATGFAIYSTTAHRLLYASFGHPEWAPTAETVVTMSPSLFFSVAGDQHLYLLVAYQGAWESGVGQWAIFDVRDGRPLTADLEE